MKQTHLHWYYDILKIFLMVIKRANVPLFSFENRVYWITPKTYLVHWKTPQITSRIWCMTQCRGWPGKIIENYLYISFQLPNTESQKPRQRVSVANRKVFARPEIFCASGKFLRGWYITAVLKAHICLHSANYTHAKCCLSLDSCDCFWKV